MTTPDTLKALIAKWRLDWPCDSRKWADELEALLASEPTPPAPSPRADVRGFLREAKRAVENYCGHPIDGSETCACDRIMADLTAALALGERPAPAPADIVTIRQQIEDAINYCDGGETWTDGFQAAIDVILERCPALSLAEVVTVHAREETVVASPVSGGSMTLTNAQIAELCHEANRAYCRIVMGDESQKPWAEAPAWQRESAINGVAFAKGGSTPAAQHQAWCDDKLKDGWAYGEVQDADTKTHPCLVPYDQLAPGQHGKDELFVAIVRAFA